jgi:hypothetical protein
LRDAPKLRCTPESTRSHGFLKLGLLLALSVAAAQETGSSHFTVKPAVAEAAQLTIAWIEDKGVPSQVAVVKTIKGTRSVVAASHGSAYLIDPASYA